MTKSSPDSGVSLASWDRGRVDAAANRPRSGYYKNLFEEAAALMESVSNNHGFVDGNKRTGFAATDIFLRLNGFYLSVKSEVAHAFITEAMAQKSFKFEMILKWLFQIAERIPGRRQRRRRRRRRRALQHS